MSKTALMMRIIACTFVITTVSSICYAETYTNPVTIRCSSAVEKAGWKLVIGEPKAQYTLIAEGIQVNSEKEENRGFVVVWDDLENAIFRNADAQVIAMCVAAGQKPDGRGITIYSFPQGTTPPSLICPKGYGVAMRFLSPNSDNPEDYVFHAKLTVTIDDEDETAIKRPPSVRAQIRVKSPTVVRTRAAAPASFLDSAIAGGSYR